ncbi:MAG: crosslink repair DNA glycosylase YcaQ family protein [Chloroflexota bacterium]
MTQRTLTQWHLNRALLARQLLLERSTLSIPAEPHRARVFNTRNPFSVGTYLVDGAVAGAWSLRDGRIELDGFEPLPTAQQRAVNDERDALEAFHA